MSSRVSRARSRTSMLVGALLLLAAFAPAGAFARSDDDAVLSPLAFEVFSPPSPVEGADGRNHLAYELEIANQSALDVTIERVQTLANGRPLGTALTGDALTDRLRLNGGGAGATVNAGIGAMLFVDAIYPRKQRTPRSISHSVTLSWPDPDAPGTTKRQTWIGVEARLDRRPAVEVAPPLFGANWVAGNGCCVANAHRAATLAIDGTIRVPERFAIDFVQLDAQNRLFDGPNVLSSYAFFGAPIHAVAPGKVVSVRTSLPEQAPGKLPADATIQTAGGNDVVVDIGRGRFAFYAHMQTDSARVKKGDRVKTGDVLGLLGNTGNTDAPHLHFHVMDSPSPLQSSGLPYTFTAFKGQGVVTDEPALLSGAVTPIDTAKYAGRHRGQLPLSIQVVDFGSPPRSR